MIKCRVKNYSDLVTVVGSIPEVHVGSVLYMGGSWKVDPKYGRQFSMETFEETKERLQSALPESASRMTLYNKAVSITKTEPVRNAQAKKVDVTEKVVSNKL